MIGNVSRPNIFFVKGVSPPLFFLSKFNEDVIHYRTSFDFFSIILILTFILFYFQRVPPLRVDDLIHDLRDGTKLLALLEVLSGDKLVRNKKLKINIKIKTKNFFFFLLTACGERQSIT